MDKRKKLIVYFTIIIVFLLVLVIGATYAYFTVTSTNSFGSKTISASAPSVGTVQLISDNNTISLNLSASNMMKSNAGTYYATTTGIPTTTPNSIKLAHTQVTGEGTFNCAYNLDITASGTNNLYTAFQNWSNKGEEEIVLLVNGQWYDFNTSNLFPITIERTMKGVKADSARHVVTTFWFWNASGLNQDILKNKDITLTFTMSNFNCSIAGEPRYFVYASDRPNGLSAPLTSNSGLSYYIKGYADSDNYAEVCGNFGGTEYCLAPTKDISISTYYNEMTSLGASCNSDYATTSDLTCRYGNVQCSIWDFPLIPSVNCKRVTSPIEGCTIMNDGYIECWYD